MVSDFKTGAILYHGSTDAIRVPVTYLSQSSVDFGPGFYCTLQKHQAEVWGRIKINKDHRFPQYAVPEYLFKDEGTLTRKIFSEPSAEWMKIVYDG